MLDKFMQLPDDVRSFILRAALIVLAAAVFLTVISLMILKNKRLFKKLKRNLDEIEKNKIDPISVDTLTLSDVNLWFKDNMKSGTLGIFETAEALKAKNHNIEIPSGRGGSVYYLSIYHPGKKKDLAHRCYIANQIDPELQELLTEHSGSVVFEK